MVESINKAGDHAAAKRIIGTAKTLKTIEAADPAFDLRAGEAVGDRRVPLGDVSMALIGLSQRRAEERLSAGPVRPCVTLRQGIAYSAGMTHAAKQTDSNSTRSKTGPPWPTEAKKRRQHHVWQHYLKAWCTDGELYCLTKGRIFPTGTKATAVEKDFYKIGKLTAADIALIRFLVIDVKGTHPLTRKNHEDFLKIVTAPARFEGNLAELDDLIDTFRTNALEDYHAGIEAAFVPLLESALRKDIGFFSDERSCITLFHFLASQHMRTKGVKVNTIEILRRKSGLDTSRIWGIMSHMFARNIAMGVFLERKRRNLVLVESMTDLAFVTGDQPIINLHGGDGERSPATLSWYYPISPCLALFLTEVDEEPPFTTASLTSAQVSELNAKIVEASHSQVFAQSRESLEPYVSKAKI